MDIKTKMIIILAIAYNGLLGYAIKFISAPYIVMVFFALDIFLIAYYVLFLIKENYGISAIGIKHKEQISRAKEELKQQGYTTK